MNIPLSEAIPSEIILKILNAFRKNALKAPPLPVNTNEVDATENTAKLLQTSMCIKNLNQDFYLYQTFKISTYIGQATNICTTGKLYDIKQATQIMRELYVSITQDESWSVFEEYMSLSEQDFNAIQNLGGGCTSPEFANVFLAHSAIISHILWERILTPMGTLFATFNGDLSAFQNTLLDMAMDYAEANLNNQNLNFNINIETETVDKKETTHSMANVIALP